MQKEIIIQPNQNPFFEAIELFMQGKFSEAKQKLTALKEKKKDEPLVFYLLYKIEKNGLANSFDNIQNLFNDFINAIKSKYPNIIFDQKLSLPVSTGLKNRTAYELFFISLCWIESNSILKYSSYTKNNLKDIIETISPSSIANKFILSEAYFKLAEDTLGQDYNTYISGTTQHSSALQAFKEAAKYGSYLAEDAALAIELQHIFYFKNMTKEETSKLKDRLLDLSKDRNYPSANFQLYLLHKVFEIPFVEAVNFLRKAAEKNFILALYSYACLFKSVNFKNALLWYEKASFLGHIQAKAEVAVVYDEGKIVERDINKAFNLFSALAMVQNLPIFMLANYKLGMYHLTFSLGKFHLISPLRSAKTFFKKAADRGCLHSKYQFALLLMDGVFENQSTKEAMELFLEVAEQAESPLCLLAKLEIIKIYLCGEFKFDQSTISKYSSDISKLETEEAKYVLAQISLYGFENSSETNELDIEPDHTQGLKELQQLANAGFMPAQQELFYYCIENNKLDMIRTEVDSWVKANFSFGKLILGLSLLPTKDLAKIKEFHIVKSAIKFSTHQNTEKGYTLIEEANSQNLLQAKTLLRILKDSYSKKTSGEIKEFKDNIWPKDDSHLCFFIYELMKFLNDSIEDLKSQEYQWLEKSARLNNAEAMYQFAQHKKNHDPKAAEFWLMKAAQKGHLEAIKIFARQSEFTLERKTLLSYLAMAVKRGNITASHLYAQMLLEMYFKLDSSAIDTNLEAIFPFIKEAAAESMDAKHYYARCLYQGLGTAQDKAKALQLFEELAENEHLESMYQYGLALYGNNGTSKNQELAIELWQKAAKSNHGKSLFMLGSHNIIAINQNLGAVADIDALNEVDRELLIKAYQYFDRAANTGESNSHDYFKMNTTFAFRFCILFHRWADLEYHFDKHPHLMNNVLKSDTVNQLLKEVIQHAPETSLGKLFSQHTQIPLVELGNQQTILIILLQRNFLTTIQVILRNSQKITNDAFSFNFFSRLDKGNFFICINKLIQNPRFKFFDILEFGKRTDLSNNEVTYIIEEFKKNKIFVKIYFGDFIYKDVAKYNDEVDQHQTAFRGKQSLEEAKILFDDIVKLTDSSTPSNLTDLSSDETAADKLTNKFEAAVEHAKNAVKYLSHKQDELPKAQDLLIKILDGYLQLLRLHHQLDDALELLLQVKEIEALSKELPKFYYELAEAWAIGESQGFIVKDDFKISIRQLKTCAILTQAIFLFEKLPQDPNTSSMNEKAKTLLSRNMNQILGMGFSLDTDFKQILKSQHIGIVTIELTKMRNSLFDKKPAITSKKDIGHFVNTVCSDNALTCFTLITPDSSTQIISSQSVSENFNSNNFLNFNTKNQNGGEGNESVPSSFWSNSKRKQEENQEQATKCQKSENNNNNNSNNNHPS